MKDFFIQNRDTIISLLGGIIAFLRGIKQFYQSQKQQLKIKELESKLEVERHQVLLNDNKFRKGYEDFTTLIMDVINQNKSLSKTDKGLIDFMKIAILFAGPETLKSFGAYRKNGGKIDVLENIENLLLSMRKDLGVGNAGLEKYDILQTFIVGDVKEEIKKK